jgi:hypothetical protein
MRPSSLLAAFSAFAIAAIGLVGTAHAAVPGLVDGSITVGSSSCSWTNATTSDVPPNTLTVDHNTVAETCSGISVDLANDPTVNFDDAAGTASSPQIDVIGSTLGVECAYRVSNVSVARQGTTRTYTGGPFNAALTSGGFLCPGSQTVDSATFTFH